MPRVVRFRGLGMMNRWNPRSRSSCAEEPTHRRDRRRSCSPLSHGLVNLLCCSCALGTLGQALQDKYSPQVLCSLELWGRVASFDWISLPEMRDSGSLDDWRQQGLRGVDVVVVAAVVLWS